MFISKPKVKDLLAFLAGCDPEAPVLISDGHEGVNQLETTTGFVRLDGHGYVTDGYVQSVEGLVRNPAKPGAVTVTAVQLDTGT